MSIAEKKLLENAFELKNHGEHEQAIAKFKTVLEKFPSSGITASMIANLYYSEFNDPEMALPYAERAIKLLPKSETTSFCLSLCLFKLNRKADMYSEIERYVNNGGKIDLYNTLFEENELTIDDFT